MLDQIFKFEISKGYTFRLQRYRIKKIWVCCKDSIPFLAFNCLFGILQYAYTTLIGLNFKNIPENKLMSKRIWRLTKVEIKHWFLRDKLLLKICNVLCYFKTEKLCTILTTKNCKIHFLSFWKVQTNNSVNMKKNLVNMVCLDISLRA